MVAEAEVEAAADSLAAAGFRIERPPEDWLFKAWLDDSLVDVLHRLRGIPVEPELVASAVEVEVLGIRIPVLPATPIMIAKLVSLSELYADFGALLPSVRAVREQLDWAELRSSCEDCPSRRPSSSSATGSTSPPRPDLSGVQRKEVACSEVGPACGRRRWETSTVSQPTRHGTPIPPHLTWPAC